MEGGELFSRIQERGDQAFTERGECVQLDQWGFGLGQRSCAVLGQACSSLCLRLPI